MKTWSIWKKNCKNQTMGHISNAILPTFFLVPRYIPKRHICWPRWRWPWSTDILDDSGDRSRSYFPKTKITKNKTMGYVKDIVYHHLDPLRNSTQTIHFYLMEVICVLFLNYLGNEGSSLFAPNSKFVICGSLTLYFANSLYWVFNSTSIFLWTCYLFSEMLASLNRSPPSNANRERRVKYQHPKGAPDADLIFGSGPK